MPEQARVYRLLAQLLREVDRETVIHSLLASCMRGPAGFAELLPHLPADLAWARARCAPGPHAAALDGAAEALDEAAVACQAAPEAPSGRRDAVRLLAPGGALATALSLLSTAPEPYYQRLGDRLTHELRGAETHRPHHWPAAAAAPI